MTNQMFSEEAASALKEYCEKHQDVIQKANDALLSSDFTPIRGAYMDISVLKDIRLGTMVMMANGDKDVIDYLIAGLPKYNIRPDRSFMTYAYPEYKAATEEQLLWATKDASNSERIFNLSPDTIVLRDISRLINQILQQNSRCGYTVPLKLTINLYPLRESKSTKVFKDLLARYLGTEVSVSYVRIEPPNVTSDIWLGYDLILLDDIIPYASVNTVFTDLLYTENSPLLSTLILTYPASSTKAYAEFLDKGMPVDDPVEYMQRMSSTQLYFNIYSKFDYMFYRVPEPTSNQG